MQRRPERGPGTVRFDATERLVHWSTALIVLAVAATGAILYVPALSVAVGRRLLVENVHVYVGCGIFAPVLLAMAGRWGHRLRADLHQMSGLSTDEVSWLRTFGRRGREAIGKFNPGQKMNTSAIGGLLTVMLMTGLVMRWGNFLPVYVRTGATFVHDVFAFVLVGLVVAHIAMAVAHPQALRSMVTGRVTQAWAHHHAPAWLPVPPQTKGEIDAPS